MNVDKSSIGVVNAERNNLEPNTNVMTEWNRYNDMNLKDKHEGEAT